MKFIIGQRARRVGRGKTVTIIGLGLECGERVYDLSDSTWAYPEQLELA